MKPTILDSKLRTSVRRLAYALPAILCAATAHAGTTELTQQTLAGILGYFADPENVRGLFGAASGALVAILAARLSARDAARDSDEG